MALIIWDGVDISFIKELGSEKNIKKEVRQMKKKIKLGKNP